jgi:hypothetical protein
VVGRFHGAHKPHLYDDKLAKEAARPAPGLEPAPSWFPKAEMARNSAPTPIMAGSSFRIMQYRCRQVSSGAAGAWSKAGAHHQAIAGECLDADRIRV